MKPIKRVGLGLLYYNKGLQQFERALQEAMDDLRISGLIDEISLIVQDGAPVDYARESIVDNAIARDLDAVIWIDTDLVIPRDALIRLVSMSSVGMPVAAGLYRRAMFNPDDRFLLTIRTVDPSRALNDLRNGGAKNIHWATLEELREHAEGGVTRVALSAGGFSIVRREVYQMVREKCGPPWYCTYDFQVGDWSFEDTFFQRRLRKLDIPVYVDPELHAVHWSHYGPVPVTPDDPVMAELLS